MIATGPAQSSHFARMYQCNLEAPSAFTFVSSE
jgi:hypothetical protein